MRLELMTSPAVADYLTRRQGILIPVGATEQHGPDGLIGTDHLCAQAIARRCGEEHGIVVAPTLSYGMSQFHLAFPGTVTLRPSTLAAMVHDIVASLAATGFRRLYFLNGHGGNLAPLRCGIQEYHAARSLAGGEGLASVQCRLKSWWEMPAADALRKSLYGAQEGFHVTPSEVALTMATHPDVIAPFDRPPPITVGEDLIVHAGDNYHDAADYRARFPDGRVISHSALATRAAGEELLKLAVQDLSADFDAFCRAA
ncbi:MAG TPA: creatininase family protein [Beijerinckiaceae bacterium]|nr:creatininase family protein [Beijerinckiaceae bacterium]